MPRVLPSKFFVVALLFGLGLSIEQLPAVAFAAEADQAAADDAQPASLVVRLPANAELFVQDQKIRGSGAERKFKSPPLSPAKKYTYVVRIVWTAGGQKLSAEQRVPVRAGQEVIVSLPPPAQPAAPPGEPVAAPQGKTPAAPADDKAAQLTADEQGILDLTNKERAKTGAKPLTANAQLTAAARGHSANMARQKILNHTLDDKQFFQRIEATGYKSGAAGENIAYGARTPAEVVTMWMNSEGHKMNILNGQYQQIGIGIAVAADGTRYYTQVFASPLEIPQ